MENGKLSFLVVGAGAVGGITAALLKKAGHDVILAARDPGYASLISERGLVISGTCGNFTIKIPSCSSVSGVGRKMDIILLATKNTEMINAARAYSSVLKDNGYFISMQNGIAEDDLASEIGKERVIGCVTGWGATMETHGSLVMTSGGDFIIGYTDKKPDDHLSQIAEILSSVVPVRITDNIRGHKYSKLIINSCITSLGAICGMYLGDMLAKRKIRKIFIEIIREAVIVADRKNIRMEVFAGKIDFRKFINGKGFLPDIKRHLLILGIGLKYRKLKSSSLQSLERGQKSEIDWLNGYIVKHGLEPGVNVPVNKAVVDMIHEIEDGKRKILNENFNDPAFDVIR